VYGIRLLRQRPLQIAALAIVAAVVLAFRALQFALLTRQVQWGYDFSFYWTAGRRLLNGESIYSAAQLAGPYAPQGQDGFLYPPPVAALATPLAAVFPSDYRAAAWAWTVLGAAILVLSVLALWRSERLGERFPLLAGRGRWLLVAAAFAFPPVVGELVLGNVHLVLLGLVTLAWLGIHRGGARGEWIAGLAVGVAAVIKVFPGLLLLWFLLQRRYRAAAGLIVGAAVLTLVTLPITGIESWLQYPTVLTNLSAPSDMRDTLAPTVWLAGPLGFTLARLIVTVVGLGILAWGAMGARLSAARSFAIAVTLSILIAPAMYHHYLALLVLPLILGLTSGVSFRWIVLSYFLMWGGEQSALGDVSWIVNRAFPTAGALVLLVALMSGRQRLGDVEDREEGEQHAKSAERGRLEPRGVAVGQDP
jgi:alpha-1,2-mannosyltransferase